jgi:hypothetical protein
MFLVHRCGYDDDKKDFQTSSYFLRKKYKLNKHYATSFFLFIGRPLADRSVRDVHYQFSYKSRTEAVLFEV